MHFLKVSSGALFGTFLSLVLVSCSVQSPSPIVSTEVGSRVHVNHGPKTKILPPKKSGNINYKVAAVNDSDVHVSTLTGTNTPGYTDGPPSSAQFNQPWAIVADTDGTLYVADSANNCIRKITPDGTVSTFAGTGAPGLIDGPGGSAQFNYPDGIAIGMPTGGNLSQKRIYVSDFSNHAIRTIDMNGNVTTLVGNGTPGDEDFGVTQGKLNGPCGLEYKNGFLYVADWYNNKIRRVDAGTGAITTFAGSGVQGYVNGNDEVAQFSNPNDVTIGGGATGFVMYVADYNNHAVRKIDQGQVTTLVGGPDKFGYQDGDPAAAQFTYPAAVKLNRGDVYIADEGNNVVRKVDTANLLPVSVSTFAGSGSYGDADGSGASAMFSSPEGIEVTDNGTDHGVVYTTEYFTSRIRGSLVFSLSPQKPAFSPNGDNKLDVASIQISAARPWTLAYESSQHSGVITSGPGSQTATWNGKNVSTQETLPDGLYSLKLTSGNLVQSAVVNLDTVAPALSNFEVRGDETAETILFKADAANPSPANEPSALDPTTLSFNINGHLVTETSPTLGATSVSQPLTYEQFGDICDETSSTASEQPIVVTVSDIAGNTGTLNYQDTSNSDVVAMQTTVDETCLDPSSDECATPDATAYKVQTIIAEPIFRPLVGKYRVNLAVTTDRFTVYRYAIYNASTPRAVFSKTYFFTPLPGIPQSRTFDWTGRRNGWEPYSQGQYTQRLYNANTRVAEKLDFEIDNRVQYDYKEQLGDAHKQQHIIWGSATNTSTHNWNYFIPFPISPKIPTPVELANVYNIYNPYVSDQIKQAMKFQYITSEKNVTTGGINPEYTYKTNDLAGVSRTVTVRAFRKFDNSAGIIKEVVSDGWVN